MMSRTLALEKLHHHLFSTPECDSTSIDHLEHDLVLWLNHHSFEELPDALEYYLPDPTSDVEADLTHLNLQEKRGVPVTIHPIVIIYIHSLTAWAKCFLTTYGEYPGLYDLLDTPRSVFLPAQLHLCDSTFPMPLFAAPPSPSHPTQLSVHLSTHTSIHRLICLSHN